jgi:hypothetical protein
MKCAKVFNLFENIVKAIASQNAFIIYLKNFLIFLRVFNAQGTLVLKQKANDRNAFMDLVKTVQVITRFGHGVVCDLVHQKNKSIVNMRPKLREVLSKNFQAVRALLPLANIPLDAIFLGALKNYDAKGDEIWSQNTMASSGVQESDEEQDEEQMEVSDDETIGNLVEMDAEEDSQVQHASFRSRSTIL